MAHTAAWNPLVLVLVLVFVLASALGEESCSPDRSSSDNFAAGYDALTNETRDVPTGLACFTVAAEQGDTIAQYNLGVILKDKFTVGKEGVNLTGSIYWLKKAAGNDYFNAVCRPRSLAAACAPCAHAVRPAP